MIAAAVASATVSFLTISRPTTPPATDIASRTDARHASRSAHGRAVRNDGMSPASLSPLAQADRDRIRAPERGLVAPLPATLAIVSPSLQRAELDEIDAQTSGTEEFMPTPEEAAIELVIPAHRDAEAVVGFHQAGPRSGAQALVPFGSTVASDFPGFNVFDSQDGHGSEHVVLASRGRGTSPTSAVDVALHAGENVLAPLDGTVVNVAPYSLYGETRDVTVAIRSTSDPSLAVHLFHLEGPMVEEGQEVTAGVTPLATVRELPFASQIDRTTKDGRPHVHLEVRAAP